jgi:hypothetical protein
VFYLGTISSYFNKQYAKERKRTYISIKHVTNKRQNKKQTNEKKKYTKRLNITEMKGKI